ncbi:MAG: hypothetical protein R3B06_30430 [Kofleriaceae bacterium]
MPRTRTRLLGQALRLGGVTGAAALLLASTQAGDRAVDDGTCPAGETCSPETPAGLLFEGAPLGYIPAITAHTIAAGGRQTFTIIDKATMAPLAAPFAVATTDATFAGTPVGPAAVAVTARGAGAALLRVLSPEGLLYDRVDVTSRVITDVVAYPTHTAAYPAIMPPRWVGFAGGRVEVALQLRADADDVVDEGLQVTTAAQLQRTAWNTFALVAPAAGAIDLAVDAGDQRGLAATVTVVDQFDRIDAPPARAIGVGGVTTVCFSAKTATAAGDALVVGVPWRLTLAGPATAEAAQPHPACLELTPTATGTVTVTATAAGHTATATLDVTGAAKPSGPAWAWLGTDGERAAASE